MKNKIIVIVFCALLAFASCSQPDTTTDINAQLTPEITATEIITVAPTDTPIPTPSPTAVPTKPKYIFIVIGDGFGRGAMTLGEIYARLESEDMSKGAAWEDFTVQNYVTAMGESASGGTAISCGVETDPWYIGKNIDGQEMYTIMDRAKEAGYATGVITNSSITDATPATFMSHITNRYGFTRIADCFPDSNVDFIAGGGLISVLPEKPGDIFDGVDAMNYTPELVGSEWLIPELIDMGYETYFGLAGSIALRSELASGTYNPEKSINLFTGGIMPYEYYKYSSNAGTKYDDVPTLTEMAQAGIQSLSQNENGFVMMIESGLIDKCGHKANEEMEIYEIRELNNLLQELMAFYNEHPYETMIILTADHETGNYAHNDELLDQWKEKSPFVWTDSGSDMAAFLTQEWGINAYSKNLETQINKSNAAEIGTISDNRAYLYTEVTMYTAGKYGTKIRSSEHSGQLVPLFVIGTGSDIFEGSTHIKEIPAKICDIMGWAPLPEVKLPQE